MPADRDHLRAAYDVVAGAYAERFVDELRHKPLDRALLNMVADEFGDRGIVADIGTGPGHVARYLSDHGIRALGVDLSPEMIAHAGRLHPSVQFEVGDMLALQQEDGTFAAITAFYAIVHLSLAEVRNAVREFLRVLQPRGLVLLSFHVGSEDIYVEEFLGAHVRLVFRLFKVADIQRALVDAGFVVEASIERRAYTEEHPTLRGYVLARAP